MISLIRQGDHIELDSANGILTLHVDSVELDKRVPATQDLSTSEIGLGRELFSGFRAMAGSAESGATIFKWDSI